MVIADAAAAVAVAVAAAVVVAVVVVFAASAVVVAADVDGGGGVGWGVARSLRTVLCVWLFVSGFVIVLVFVHKANLKFSVYMLLAIGRICSACIMLYLVVLMCWLECCCEYAVSS